MQCMQGFSVIYLQVWLPGCAAPSSARAPLGPQCPLSTAHCSAHSCASACAMRPQPSKQPSGTAGVSHPQHDGQPFQIDCGWWSCGGRLRVRQRDVCVCDGQEAESSAAPVAAGDAELAAGRMLGGSDPLLPAPVTVALQSSQQLPLSGRQLYSYPELHYHRLCRHWRMTVDFTAPKCTSQAWKRCHRNCCPCSCSSF